MFPGSFKASPLLRAWLRRLDSPNPLGGSITFMARHRWIGWDGTGALLFEAADGTRLSVKPRATVLALGGASWPRLGADGGWVPLLRIAGIEVRDLEPANSGCEIAWSDIFRERFAGAPLKRIAASFDGTTVLGEAIVTATGLEGGAIYALSSRLRQGLKAERTCTQTRACTLTLDLRPDVSLDRLVYRLQAPRGKQTFSNYVRKATGLSPVAIGLLREGTGGHPAPSDPERLAGRIKALPLHVTGMQGLARAISTSGGVALSAVDAQSMLRKKPGVFVAGEMLDWEAPTGGYLLQGCFSTGRAAARGALRWLGRPPAEAGNPAWTLAATVTAAPGISEPAPSDDASEPAA